MVHPSLNNFTLIGINHWDAPVEIREKFSLIGERKRLFLDGAKREGIESIFVISTCNRTEVIANGATTRELIRLLTTYSSGNLDEFHKYGFELEGPRAIEHLFKVATGLDSQILGDLQIVKQVKEGYELSGSEGMISGEMHRLMQHVFRAHKRSRNETSLGQGAATVAYAAVKFAVQTFENLHDKNILLVGTGKIGKVTCKNLINLGASKLTLINRTRDRAEFVADKFNLEVADMERLPEQIADADLVIVATGASEPVIRPEHMQPSMENPKFKIMLDLSVPRNIDPNVATLDFVDVANMDMLGDVTDEAYSKREEEVPLVKKIIEQELSDYQLWISEQRVVPTIKALTRKFEAIREDEFQFFRNKISSKDQQKIDNLTRRIVNKIAAYSIEHLRDHHQSDDVAKMVEDMFKLETEEK
ncbi:glutamyl-tRNA reductase [Rhodohalobacter sp. SW132]|uniref:glutamyl-tRNA reductase n=1 Tax=Rhodohalobacter sp. SW132 TaxID=2293433 RepID=UPI000E27044B|nr:glutamyl-tRNA reductase [Rhodohalobacter sp. SW132]REL24128.1 glutamyl-tRNA reductase [Rhodohalobacter sp. SW132]